MPADILFAINQKLWRLEKLLDEVREKVRGLEEDERALAWMHKVEDARLRHIERVVRGLEPQGWVRRLLMRLIGATRPDMVRDITGILLEPVVGELEELRKRLADARKEVCRLEEEARRLTSRKHEITYARKRPNEETIRRFEAPGRVRTALTRMVEDVFATMKRQEKAGEAGDFEEIWRLMEVEKAQRAQLHALWRIDPVCHAKGTWTAVTREKHLPHGMGACFPAMRAENVTSERLKEARIHGCRSEVQRLEEEERMLREMGDEIGGCVILEPRPAGFLAPPKTSPSQSGMNGRHL